MRTRMRAGAPVPTRPSLAPQTSLNRDAGPLRRDRVGCEAVLALRSAIIAALAFAYLVAYPLVIGRADESHLLYGARRILEGQVIYRDFFESITPLAYWLFAAVYRVAGTTLFAARVVIALVEGL